MRRRRCEKDTQKDVGKDKDKDRGGGGKNPILDDFRGQKVEESQL